MELERDSSEETAGVVRHWSNADEDGDPVPILEPGGTYDIILASDVTYFRSAFRFGGKRERNM